MEMISTQPKEKEEIISTKKKKVENSFFNFFRDEKNDPVKVKTSPSVFKEKKSVHQIYSEPNSESEDEEILEFNRKPKTLSMESQDLQPPKRKHSLLDLSNDDDDIFSIGPSKSLTSSEKPQSEGIINLVQSPSKKPKTKSNEFITIDSDIEDISWEDGDDIPSVVESSTKSTSISHFQINDTLISTPQPSITKRTNQTPSTSSPSPLLSKIPQYTTAVKNTQKNSSVQSYNKPDISIGSNNFTIDIPPSTPYRLSSTNNTQNSSQSPQFISKVQKSNK